MIPVSEIREYENNPRDNEGAVPAVAESIREFGFKVPIVVDEDWVVVAGHTRLKAARRLGLAEAPCVVASDLTPEQVKAYRLADNKTGELAEWDFSALEMELAELEGFDMEAFGFDMSEFDMGANDEASPSEALEEGRSSLEEKFIIPPFSVLDTKSGRWQERKRVWSSILRSGEGRDVGLLGQGLYDLAQKYGQSSLTGTSIFDPVLCELLVNWFCPPGGKVLDPFAGGSVRGLVTSLLGNRYVGVDLRPEQIEANESAYGAIAGSRDLIGGELGKPEWLVGDSTGIDSLVAEDGFDFLLTCPPYADLEVYSDDPRDISTMEYDDFLRSYREIISKSCDKLRDGSFAAIVVGEVRDKHRFYRNFVGDTVEAFRDAGLGYHNEMVLLNAIGTGALRAGKQFSASRKVVKTHQNVLVFAKGNEKAAAKRLTAYDYDLKELHEE